MLEPGRQIDKQQSTRDPCCYESILICSVAELALAVSAPAPSLTGGSKSARVLATGCDQGQRRCIDNLNRHGARREVSAAELAECICSPTERIAA
jgi:hypothetical protein